MSLSDDQTEVAGEVFAAVTLMLERRAGDPRAAASQAFSEATISDQLRSAAALGVSVSYIANIVTLLAGILDIEPGACWAWIRQRVEELDL